MKKKIILGLGAVAVVIAGVASFSAFEAHVINVTAKIENALHVELKGIDFGTVFPQEELEKGFTISLSESFMDQAENEKRVDVVDYKIVQKPKPWTLNFGGREDDVDAHNRKLVFVDPSGVGKHEFIDGQLIITTGLVISDLYGPGEPGDGTNWDAPRMVFPMGGNFRIETKVTASPNQYPPDPYQSGGILVYGSDGNVVRLELTGFSGLDGPAVYMENQIGAKKVGKGWDGLGSVTAVWLRLSRNGNTFKGEYSSDGITWNDVTTIEGDFVNSAVGVQPMVGLAVVDNKDESTFSAAFDYVTFNGGYSDLCPFLAKTSIDTNTIGHPSYFVPGIDQDLDSCQIVEGDATGILTYNVSESHAWKLGLKVPPFHGYVGQDWPAGCPVLENADPTGTDMGCDLWIEVTNISRQPE